MPSLRAVPLLLLAAAAVAACMTRPTASTASVAAHVADAERLAGQDLKQLLVLCEPAPPVRPPQALIDEGIARQMARVPPEPGRAFDNLYYVGSAWVSAWAIKTSEGVILIDALNNEQEASTVLEGGLRKVGLDPAQVRYVLVTHAHGDHYGGADYLAKRYRTRVAISEPDWAVARVQPEVNSSHWGPVPRADVVLKQGEPLALGDGRVIAQLTPGHTVGTISPVFEVKHAGRSHKVLLWGGTAFNFGRDLGRLDTYIEATDRMADLARREGIDVLLSNHPNYDNSMAKLAALRADPNAASNPFVMGTPNVVRALQVMGACARAQRDRFVLQPGPTARRLLPPREEHDEHVHEG